MMTIKLNRAFRKQVKNLKPAQQWRLRAAMELFQTEPHHQDLYNHSLTGEWHGHRSISFGGDWRAHYKVIDKDTVLFVAVGSHNQLYG